jgi:hypothetical protein
VVNEAEIRRFFPGLNVAHLRVTSAETTDYNCIAWAAGDAEHWWWPGPEQSGVYWPPRIDRQATLDVFIAAYATLGYEVCATGDFDRRYEKVALFADSHGVPTHAARQLQNGHWTSKLGPSEDIEHELAGLEGVAYGAVVKFLRRRLRAPRRRNTIVKWLDAMRRAVLQLFRRSPK